MNQDKRIATVPLAAFILLKPFISTEETRYYLNGVHLTPHEPCDPVDGNSVAVATDGHIIGAYGFGEAATDAADVREPVIVSRHAIETLVKATPRKLHGEAKVVVTKACKTPCEATFRIVDAAGDTLSLHPMPLDGLIDGSFPDWRRVVAGARKDIGELPKHMPLFSGRLLNTAGVVAKEIRRLAGSKDSAFVSIQPGKSDGGPAEFTVCEDARFYGLLMPGRGEASPHSAIRSTEVHDHAA